MSCRDDLSLLEQIWRQRWPAVERRAIACPYELDLEHQGLTAIHWACANDAPASTLRILLSKSRHASSKDLDGMTPLNLWLSATDHPTLEAVHAFCEFAPDSISMRDYFRRTPLHYICGKGVEHQPQANLDVAQLLLQMDPSLADMSNSDGETALDRLWQSCGYVDGDADDALGYFWKLVQLILSASCPDVGGSLLHQLVSYPSCRANILDYACSWNPDWLETTDDQGNTALHQAMKQIQPASLVYILVRRRPHLVSCLNHDNKLALHMAQQWSPAQELLLRVHPQSLELTHLDESLYPQILSQLDAPQTVFEVLRNKPSLCIHHSPRSYTYT
jgi:hypothetical protein